MNPSDAGTPTDPSITSTFPAPAALPVLGGATAAPVLVAACEPAQAFSIVGIGASAGGLEALQRFFERVPTDSGLAYVVVQHLSPDFKSLMEELLRRHTAVPIKRVVDGVTVEPNVIYLIPPNTDMIITSGRLHLTERDPEQALTLPIDLFFRSLAQDAGDRAIAVVLSGSGSDGSRGVRAIHDAGGLVIVQDERTAKFDGMPRSSIDTGVADLVLPPAAIPDALMLHARRAHAVRAAAAADGDVSKDELDGLGPIFALLRREYGIDFTHYKPSTVVRRIQRRLLLNEIGDLATYTKRLQQEQDELDALYRDLLIGVTRFFRDPEAFARLRECIGPLMQRLEPEEELRVWCAACATGEEAYTVAIVALESMRVLGRKPRLKVFATDAHRTSLEISGAGRYNAESMRALPADLRDRYFQPQGEGWLVRPELRSHVVFAPHNVLRDAPFTRLDLITCRNLLIYFQPQAQRKVLSLFHFALKAGGILLLGPSETPGDLGDEFQSIDDHWKLYRKRRDIRLPNADTRLTSPPEFLPRPRRTGNKLGSYEQALVDAQERLLREYAPATLLVDEHGELLHTFKGAGAYLSNRDGPTSLSVLDLVHRDLKFAIAHGLKRAFDKREDSDFQGVRLRTEEGGEQRVEVSVRAVVRGDLVEAALISIREEEGPAASALPSVVGQGELHDPGAARLIAERIEHLELELRQTKENLQATIEEMETSNEELQATNEELIASNEELQSTNEELHSVNEELYTVNAEHQQKIAELTELTNDMDNLLASTEVHTLFLDAELRLRKFTPKIAETFHLLPQDVGRRIDSFTHTLQHDGLLDDIRRTLAEGVSIEREVRGVGGRDYLLRVLPYRAREKVEGVVFTLIDVSTLKRTEQALQTSVERYRTLVRSLATAVWTTDATGGFVEPQAEWEVFTGQTWPAYAGMDWLVAVHPADREAVAAAWRGAVERREVFETSGRISSRQEGEFRHVVMRAAPLLTEDGSVREWVGTLTDRHRERVAEQERRLIQRQLQGLLDNSPAFIHAKDPQGRYVLANPQARVYAGAEPGDVLGKTDMDLLPPEIAEEIRGNDRRVVTSGLVHEFEETLPGPGGSPRTYLSIKWPLRDEDGKLSAVAGISSDISERRRSAEENRMGLERRDRFLAMLSHELRNPLAAALNAVYTLGRADLSEKLRGRAPQIIRRQIEHMGRLLDDLLDVARLTQDRITVRREPIDLKRVLTYSIEASSDLLRSADVRLDVEVCEEPAWVDGDAARLQQVITNLLSNASKYTPSGGNVTVHLERRGASIVVRVRDTGVGLERAQLTKVFDLFYQVDSSIERARGGLGVGLSLVRSIVGLHGGLVTGYSEGLGRGSEFTVSLPAIEVPEQVTTAGRAPSGRSPMKVVVVEDNGDGRELLTEVLQESGFQVAAAADGVAGVETIGAFRPHVAFVDIGLPRIDGYEVARRVRATPTGGSVHLVAVTGYGRPEDQRRALEAGFDEHLVKPLSPDLVLSVLERARPKATSP